MGHYDHSLGWEGRGGEVLIAYKWTGLTACYRSRWKMYDGISSSETGIVITTSLSYSFYVALHWVTILQHQYLICRFAATFLLVSSLRQVLPFIKDVRSLCPWRQRGLNDCSPWKFSQWAGQWRNCSDLWNGWNFIMLLKRTRPLSPPVQKVVVHRMLSSHTVSVFSGFSAKGKESDKGQS